jgi:hypothetical protein
MANRDLIGRCGLYCGLCEIYRAYKDSRKLQEELAGKHNCKPEEVRCEGCQSIDLYGWSYEMEWGSNCNILKCQDAKNLDFCYECGEYKSCQKLSDFCEICSGLGFNLMENLENIKEGRADEWLLEQDKKWRCPECGKPIIVSYDLKTCHWCGRKLR